MAAVIDPADWKSLNGLRIAFIVPYPRHSAPSQHLKFEQYFAIFNSVGIDITHFPFMDEPFYKMVYRPGQTVEKIARTLARGWRRFCDLRALRRKADLVYLHLEAAPIPVTWFEDLLFASRMPVVYDIDDLVYLRHSSDTNRLMRWVSREKKIPTLIRRATEVIVCTDYLRRYAETFNRRVTIISSTINTTAYRVDSTRYERHDPLTVGWSGSVTTSGYLSALAPILAKLQKEIPFKFRLIGNPNGCLPGVVVEALPWRRETEVPDLAKIDIGLYPLPDEPWVMGKSGLKALQYMGLGIPTIATDTPVNRTLISPGENGFLVRSHVEWESTLRSLLVAPMQRKAIGMAGRKTVEERYSVGVTAPVYLSVLHRAVSQAAPAC